ncbi:MAG: DUF1624 domain-containing protein [Negativicutes bacterium]|nr:DUF1624 domain-containing protein [Negativicutes bacterium]
MTDWNNRIWEIDFCRGIAIILMVFFHLVVDLRDFYGYHLNYASGFWYYAGKLSAIMFMLLAGISSTLHRRRLRRGAVILAWGMALTAVTYLYDAATYIRFGILHLIGVSVILYHFIDNQPPLRLALLGVSCFIGGLLTLAAPPLPLLLPLGIRPENFTSLDYYPLLPWSGFILWGAALGKILYTERRPLIAPLPGHAPISALGRHSLAIYLVHQPILLLTLYILHRL